MLSFPGVKFITQDRKFSTEKKKYRGGKYRVNAPGLRGSSLFHDPKNPKIDMFINPDFKCVNRAAIGRYGEVGEFKPFPLILLKASSTISKELYNNPLDYSISRRVNTEGAPRRRYSQYREALAKVTATLVMHTSLEYGMVGKVSKGKFYHMSLKEIASKSGVGYERTKRVLRVLREKGALKLGKQFEKLADSTFEGHNSIRHLTKGFWEMFGFGQWMVKERSDRSSAREAQAAGEPDTQETRLLSEKWEPKREKVMDKMQSDAVMDTYLKEARSLLTG